MIFPPSFHPASGTSSSHGLHPTRHVGIKLRCCRRLWLIIQLSYLMVLSPRNQTRFSSNNYDPPHRPALRPTTAALEAVDVYGCGGKFTHVLFSRCRGKKPIHRDCIFNRRGIKLAEKIKFAILPPVGKRFTADTSLHTMAATL